MDVSCDCHHCVEAPQVEAQDQIVQWFTCPTCDGHGCKTKRIDGKPTAVLCADCGGEGQRGATEWHLENMDPGSNNPFCRHDWSYTGTQYGGDDERWGGEGRAYCSYCGADGDA